VAKAIPQRKPSTYQVTRKGLIVWGCVFIFAGGWLFFLGVLVGRGLVPPPFEADTFQNELTAQLAEETATAQARLRQGAQEGLPEEPLRIQDLRQPQVDAEVRVIPREGVTGPNGTRLKKRRVPPKKRPLPAVTHPTPGGNAETTAAAPAPATDSAEAAPAAPEESGPASSTDVDTALAGMQAKFTLQVASMRRQSAAARIVKKLQKAGFPAYQTASRPDGNGVWYRVRVGAYETRQAAEAALRQFKDSRYKPIIIQR
jgi:cell division septation protein DedD